MKNKLEQELTKYTNVNILPHDHKYVKSSLIYNMGFGLLRIKTDDVQQVWKNLAEYNYFNEFFTLFPSRIEGDTVVCKFVYREPHIYCKNDGINNELGLYPVDKARITLNWLKDHIYRNLIVEEQTADDFIVFTRGFYFDRTISEIVDILGKDEYIWNDSSKDDRELPKIIDKLMLRYIYRELNGNSKYGELNEYLKVDDLHPMTSLARIISLSNLSHIDSNVIYNNDSPNIVTRFRIKGYKKHFDVAADILRETVSDEQTFINKIENKGNKAVIEVINIRPFPWWSNIIKSAKTIEDLEKSYLKEASRKIPFNDDDYIIDIDYRLTHESIKMDYNITGIDNYQFDKNCVNYNIDELFKKEQNFMEEALKYINERRDAKRFGTTEHIELNLVFEYQEKIEDGELVTTVTNITEKTGNKDIDAVLDYMRAYKTVFGLDSETRETVIVGNESLIEAPTNLISIIRKALRYVGLAPLLNVNLNRDFRYYILNGLRSDGTGATVYFGDIRSHVMYTVTIKTQEVPKPEYFDEIINKLKDLCENVVFEGCINLDRKKVQYERID